jgi:hypothetical protein
MGAILREAPNLGIERAYTLAKAQAGPQVQPANSQTAGSSTAAPAAEGRGAGELPDLGDVLSQAEQRINDRKATPGSESYINEAIAAARKVHGE